MATESWFNSRVNDRIRIVTGARHRLAGRRDRLPRRRGDPRQSGRGSARLQRRHRRRRGLRAQVPRPAHRTRISPTGCRGATTGAPGARTPARSSTPSTTTHIARSRCGGTGWAPTRVMTCWSLEEPDEMFSVNVRTTRSGELIVIWSESRSTSEAWVLDAADPDSRPRSVGGRRHGVVYRVEHAPSPAGDRLLVVTNDDAVEFRLMTAPVPRDSDQDHTAWTEARPEDPGERLIRADAFAGGVVLSYRRRGRAPTPHRAARRPGRRRSGAGEPLRRGLPRAGAQHLLRRGHGDRPRRELPPAGRLVVGRPAHRGRDGGAARRRRRDSTPSSTSWSAARSRRRTGPPYPRCWCGTARRRWTGRRPA